jgi:hypothetical protein
MRKKEISLDGQTYTISPLSLSQVKDFLEDQRMALGKDKKGNKIDDADPQKLENVWRRFICTGLNNAGKGAEGFVPWTSERVLEELDIKFFDLLRDEILELSSLRSDVKAAPGEGQAAS